jgi:hypothetical protein
MASHHPITIRPRSLSAVLDDLKEAKSDYHDALAATRNAADAEEADDRATEAETRLSDLQAEFDVRLAEATGITVEDFRTAYAEALI